jgi:hypothetical protein
MDLVDFFCKDGESDEIQTKRKYTAVKIDSETFSYLKMVAERNGLRATSLANLLLSDFVERIKKKRKATVSKVAKSDNHSKFFDDDDDVVDFEGVI